MCGERKILGEATVNGFLLLREDGSIVWSHRGQIESRCDPVSHEQQHQHGVTRKMRADVAHLRVRLQSVMADAFQSP